MEKAEKFIQHFCEILIKNHALTGEKIKGLQKVLSESSKPEFINFLLKEGLVERTALLNALSQYYQKPAFDVIGYFFDEHLVKMFPVDVLVRNTFIPLERDQNMLMVVASEPDNPELLEIIGTYVSYDVRFMVGLAQDIIDAAREFSGGSKHLLAEEED